ncbi:uncharacterized protein UTRI_10122 [Ustilago trichophora]|uniref:Uncharacterized protein n=1 Tax=Ustilago trichophora TaxID=86804 RepID=A0A5C3DYW7_9BASI|nr:uncharacterized protein UTRI_10122 [Ustilago trichophora]
MVRVLNILFSIIPVAVMYVAAGPTTSPPKLYFTHPRKWDVWHIDNEVTIDWRNGPESRVDIGLVSTQTPDATPTWIAPSYSGRFDPEMKACNRGKLKEPCATFWWVPEDAYDPPGS